MSLRVALGSAFASFVAVAIGCSAPPGEVGKSTKGVGGSPNDPGWQPPGASSSAGADDTQPPPGDDQGEQPNPGPTCTPPPAPMTPEGFTHFDLKLVAFDLPASWTVGGFTEGTGGPILEGGEMLDKAKGSQSYSFI